MEWWKLLVFAVAAIAAVTAVPADPRPEDGSVPKICDNKNVCKCTQTVITCTCTKDMQDMVVNSAAISEANLQTLTKFEVKDCNSLSLFEQAFKLASKLEMIHISNVKNVSFSSNVFDNLQTLMIDIVGSFILHKGSFQGIRGLNNIVIRKTHIPLLTEGILHVENLQEFKLEDVNITKIEKGAVFVDFKKLGSKAEILQCKIGNIEERGLQIGNSSTITMQGTRIQRAEPRSMRLGALEIVRIKGNTFQHDVDVEAAKIQYINGIEFSKNRLLNVDLSNAANIAHVPENDTIFTIDRLVTLHGGNYVNCKCINPASNASEPLKQNGCINGCSESTVAAFLQSCQTNKAISEEERLKTLCHNTADKTSTTVRPPSPRTIPIPTNSTGNAPARTSGYMLLPITFFLCNLIL